MKLNSIIIILFFLLLNNTYQDGEELLKGFMISSDENSNIIKFAFDSNLETQFISKYASNGWVGQNFRGSRIITRIDWGNKDEDQSNYLLGVFEGANSGGFEDALPLAMITKNGTVGIMNSITIYLRRPFQYVRYVGPNGKYCKMGNIRIYGYESSISEDPITYYKPSDLPLLIIHTLSSQEPKTKTDKIESYFTLIENNDISFQSGGILLLRGNESTKNDKKSYSIRLDDSAQPLDFEINSKKWDLIPNYGDKTLIRNLVAFEISRLFEMSYTIKCQSIDLMVNGEYKGIYNFCESIDISKSQVNIKKMTKDDNEEPEISGGYLIEADGFAYLGTSFFNSKKGIPLTINYPDEDELLFIQKDYIKDKFDELEENIYNNNLTNIDLTSFIKYFLIQELIGNAQAYWSTHMYKDRNDNKFYFGPIWDNDMIFDNDNRVYPVNCKKRYIFNYGLSAGTMDKIISRIIQNEEVINKTKKIWEDAVNNKINIDYIYSFIDEQVDLLKGSMELNFMRWDILKKKVSFNPKIYSSYEEEVNQLKQFIKDRISWLNSYVLNKNTDFNNFYCKSPIPNRTKEELNYDIENNSENDEIDYELLSNSNKFVKVVSLSLIIIIIFIFF